MTHTQENELQPYSGLTLSLNNIDINIHNIKNGYVYYGKYRNGECLDMLITSITVFSGFISQAIESGASIYTLIKTEEE